MRFSKKAQSTIEYSMVIMLVMAGIIVLGPYVIRSVNAHLKSWEDVTEDAFTDPLKDRNPEGLPKPQCRCPFEPTGCGLGSCQPTEMLWQKNCVPLDCEPQEIKCVVENSCCTDWEPVGACGVGCPPGQMLKRRTCGRLPAQTACQPDGSCQNRCTGTIPDNSTPCPGDDQDVVGEVPWVPVPQGGCTDGRKCEAECKVGFVLQNGACVLPVCEPTYTIQAAGAGGGGCTPPAVGYTKPYPPGVCIDAGDDNPCCVIRCNPGDERTNWRGWCQGQCRRWVAGPVDVDPKGCYVYEGGGNKGAPWCEITCQRSCP